MESRVRQGSPQEGLRDVGLAESRIFDRALLEQAEQELKRQYLSRGLYSAQITTTTTPLERNRVAVNFTVVEGDVAKIRQIKIVGAKAFKESELIDLFQLTTPTISPGTPRTTNIRSRSCLPISKACARITSTGVTWISTLTRGFDHPPTRKTSSRST